MEMFGFLSSFGGVGSVLKLIAWFFAFLVMGGLITTAVIMLIVKKSTKKVIEINMVNKRLRIFNGRNKKKGKNVTQFWSRKIKHFLPEFQQKSVFTKGKQDVVLLIKDNNGMYHTGRLPSYSQLKKWYKVIYGIDLDDCKDYKDHKDVYLLPTPHEDLDWLSNQCVEAEKEFKINNWWESPTIAYIGVGFICFMMITVTIILQNKFG